MILKVIISFFIPLSEYTHLFFFTGAKMLIEIRVPCGHESQHNFTFFHLEGKRLSMVINRQFIIAHI